MKPVRLAHTCGTASTECGAPCAANMYNIRIFVIVTN